MADHKTAYVGQHVRIKLNAPLFPGTPAVIAYIGTCGVSVYLIDHEFDECVPLEDGEWEPIRSTTQM